mmetsp:Transcript_10432/g.29757  ORF Transcript_10432/g.29757 Transcript_10432/m.29757 type:complete len:333 (-) Transcript_10432:1305-2303(-)
MPSNYGHCQPATGNHRRLMQDPASNPQKCPGHHRHQLLWGERSSQLRRHHHTKMLTLRLFPSTAGLRLQDAVPANLEILAVLYQIEIGPLWRSLHLPPPGRGPIGLYPRHQSRGPKSRWHSPTVGRRSRDQIESLHRRSALAWIHPNSRASLGCCSFHLEKNGRCHRLRKAGFRPFCTSCPDSLMISKSTSFSALVDLTMKHDGNRSCRSPFQSSYRSNRRRSKNWPIHSSSHSTPREHHFHFESVEDLEMCPMVASPRCYWNMCHVPLRGTIRRWMRWRNASLLCWFSAGPDLDSPEKTSCPRTPGRESWCRVPPRSTWKILKDRCRHRTL